MIQSLLIYISLADLENIIKMFERRSGQASTFVDDNLVKRLYVKLWRVAHSFTSVIRLFLNIIKHFNLEFKRQYWDQFFPKKPQLLSLLVNDVNNLIKEQTGYGLEFTLRDPLFSEINRVDVIRGEPNIRNELPSLVDLVCKSLPNLHVVSLFANVVSQPHVIENVISSAKVCGNHGVDFRFSISLNNIGNLHDRDLDSDGNNDTPLNVIRHFKEQPNLHLMIMCTITKENIWSVDELLEFCQNEGLYIRYRIADFGHQFYGDTHGKEISAFTEDERYHLALFFKKLELNYEKNDGVVLIYRRLQKLLSNDSGRNIVCPYQSSALTIGRHGELRYCTPNSKIIGNKMNGSLLNLWEKNLREHRFLFKQGCNHCVFDFPAQITTFELLEQYADQFWKWFLTLKRAVLLSGKIIR